VKFRSAAAAGLIVLGVAAVLTLALLPLFGHSGSVDIYAGTAPAALSAPVSAPKASPRATPPAAATTASAIPATTETSSDAPPTGRTNAKNQAQALRVGSWNVRDCAAWDEASSEKIALHDYVAATVRDAKADIMLFQEIQSDEGKGGDIALLSVALARQGWAMPYTAVVNAKGEDDLAVFSRYKIEAEEKVLEPSAADPWPRPGIYAEVEVAGSSVYLYGFHFKAMGDEKSEAARKAQALALAAELAKRHVGSLDKDRIIIAGDFNTANPGDLEGPGSTLSTLRLLGDEDPANDFLALNYQFLPDTPSFADSRYESILDHILVSPSLAAGLGEDSIHVIEAAEGPGTIPTSDHRLLLAEIVLPGR
jgi:endonuclease/exonuclease/phosphatase family metal-dependent hydrolase